MADASNNSNNGVRRSGSEGMPVIAQTPAKIDIKELTATTSYTVYVSLSSQHFSALSNRLDLRTTTIGVPSFSNQPTASHITQTTASITLTVDEAVDYYWVVYTDPQTITTTTLISDATTSSESMPSGSGTSTTPNDDIMISLTGLNPKSSYYFYAVAADSDSNHAISSELVFETTGYPFICDNGKVASGSNTTANVTNCAKCNDYYKLDDGNSCVPTVYVCNNGTQVDTSSTPQQDKPSIANKNADVELCDSCQDGYYLDADSTSCVEGNAFQCTDGTPADGEAPNANTVKCKSCNDYFRLTDSKTCTATVYTCPHGMFDTDYTTKTPMGESEAVKNRDIQKCTGCNSGYLPVGDGCFDDIDDDNDGLIEIATLTDLHNMRYDLTGASYKTSSTDSGNTAGAPTATDKASDYVCGNTATGTCGYELINNLSFDADDDGSTWTESNGSYSLDSDDDNDVYFDVDSGGWQPIGRYGSEHYNDRFDAFFEGNGYTITGLAIRRSNTQLGLFGAFGTNNTIQNLTIADSLVVYTGNNNNSQLAIVAGRIGNYSDPQTTVVVKNVHVTGSSYTIGTGSENEIGGLAGHVHFATISDSSSSANLLAGNNRDKAGGLVGWFVDGSVTTSYATGAINGDGGDTDNVGGLVGLQSDGSITASYATGTVNGGKGHDDVVGGLVGGALDGTISASFATGTVNGGNGFGDNTGGLIGVQYDGTIIASYATGSVSGGDASFGDYVGGLVGTQLEDSTLIASYATGNVSSGNGLFDEVGGLVGWNSKGTIIASYATGDIAGGDGSSDSGGKLVGDNKGGSISASYGFGTINSDVEGNPTSIPVDAVPASEKTTPIAASDLTDSGYFTGTEAGNAWKFVSNSAPVLLYADYDGASGSTYSCNDVTLSVDGSDITLTCGSSEIPGQ